MRIQSKILETSVSHSQKRTEEHRQSIDVTVSPHAVQAPVAVTSEQSRPVSKVESAVQSAERPTELKLGARAMLMMEIVRHLIRAMTGRDWQLFLPEDFIQGPPVTEDSPSTQPGAKVPTETPSSGFGVIVQAETRIEEAEQLSYQAQGVVKTDDGRAIPFDLQLSMSRSFAESSTQVQIYGDAKRKVDPLVLNFTGQGVSLQSGASFQFDLNADGQTEPLSALGEGNAFLALDKNGDGRINDGRELFGAKTGDGFAELAALDETQDGVIDESDSAFQRMRLWTGGQKGTLVSLADVGVGALFLEQTLTPFRLTDPSNHGLGQIRSSSLFLREDGGTGAIQQIDYLI